LNHTIRITELEDFISTAHRTAFLMEELYIHATIPQPIDLGALQP
jgi:hypothetical protein